MLKKIILLHRKLEGKSGFVKGWNFILLSESDPLSDQGLGRDHKTRLSVLILIITIRILLESELESLELKVLPLLHLKAHARVPGFW